MQRIQSDQGKALQRITNENDYPMKIKGLVEELRVAREKILALDERVKREEKNAIQSQERMVQLEEICRELKSRLKAKSDAYNEKVSSQKDNISIQ